MYQCERCKTKYKTYQEVCSKCGCGIVSQMRQSELPFYKRLSSGSNVRKAGKKPIILINIIVSIIVSITVFYGCLFVSGYQKAKFQNDTLEMDIIITGMNMAVMHPVSLAGYNLYLDKNTDFFKKVDEVNSFLDFFN